MVPPEDNGLFVPYSQHDIQYKDGDVKPIAFYLPQFHAIPENDEWWGKGFTEWYNVASAVPSYYGHYQPHLPYDVGYYDLSHVDVMKRQVELAKNYGIYGFCLYYYRFGTKRLLEKPLDNFLEHKDELDIPFCVCWANENWSRRWDGQDKEVLMEQNYEADSLLCIQEIAGYFSDERYIHIGDKPLLIIYRGNLIPNVADMLDTWRRYLRDVGVGEVVIAGCAMNDVKDPVALGFDIGIDFTPNNFMTDIERQTLATSMSPTKREYHLYDMQQYLDEVDEFIKQNEEMFYTVFTSWDNTARRKSGAFIYPLSPEGYMYWLKKCIKATAENQSQDSRIVFINAWNEWADGAHLEPDRRYGYAYLEATAEAFSEGL
jgi:lipopolysaccharide biosynthesis protein